ncbi:heme-binding protein [Pelagibius litoralis]|uniref:Heme-binding protein n=1 Tax=Pelagibius litoralis TaxID=374515 RepID=A0A967KFP5_9PROT|nr:heme-binding protein [Pelagibius litoralis]NIA69721.1 heme-binding protein [Pelagibius litoralis]
MIRYPSLCLAAAAAAGFSITTAAAQDAIVTFKSLTPDVAVEAAQAALESCRAEGYQVAVSVVDRAGNLQTTIRDRFAGPHTPDTSYRKAWTSVSFRTDTLELANLSEKGEAWGIRNVSMALPLGGGVQILAGDGSMLGAIGISGAPTGTADATCARAGIEAIEEKLIF